MENVTVPKRELDEKTYKKVLWYVDPNILRKGFEDIRKDILKIIKKLVESNDTKADDIEKLNTLREKIEKISIDPTYDEEYRYAHFLASALGISLEDEDLGIGSRVDSFENSLKCRDFQLNFMYLIIDNYKAVKESFLKSIAGGKEVLNFFK